MKNKILIILLLISSISIASSRTIILTTYTFDTNIESPDGSKNVLIKGSAIEYVDVEIIELTTECVKFKTKKDKIINWCGQYTIYNRKNK